MLLSLIRGLLGGGNRSPMPPPSAERQSRTEWRCVQGPRPLEPAVETKPTEPLALSSHPVIGDQRADATALSQNREPIRRPSRGRSRRPQSLAAAGIGSAAWRRALRSIGIRTTDDLLHADPCELAERLRWPVTAEQRVRRWQRAIRMARAVPAMTPLDALMLRAVHRRTLRAIASEEAPRLHRDLKRYALSSRGAKHLGDRPLPSLDDVRRWVEGARERADRLKRS